MAITELEINGQNIQLVKKVSELENDVNYQTESQIKNILSKLNASNIPYDGSSLNENITDVDTALTFSLTKARTISDTNNIIPLTTKITNIILNNSDNTNISFSYSGQNECTIVIYNKTGNSITLPTNYKIGNYTTVLVNKISSATLLNDASCEINIMFTNGECRILTIV
jgi:hypothetical protein